MLNLCYSVKHTVIFSLQEILVLDIYIFGGIAQLSLFQRNLHICDQIKVKYHTIQQLWANTRQVLLRR